MLVTLAGISMLVKLLQPLNAEYPMLVTLAGISMLVKLLQPWRGLRRLPSGCRRKPRQGCPCGVLHKHTAILHYFFRGYNRQRGEF